MTHNIQPTGDGQSIPQNATAHNETAQDATAKETHATRKAELRRLISQACDGDLGSAEEQQLEKLLTESPELLDDFASMIATEALVELSIGKTTLGLDSFRETKAAEEITTASTSAGALVGASLKPAIRSLKERSTANAATRPSWNAGRWLPWALAATLLLAAGTWLFSRPGAHLVASEGAQWSDGQVREIGSALERGWLTLESGEVKLAHKSGAMTSIRGPARFRAAAGNYGELQYGVLAAHVPDGATGFTIETPAASVVDLGTGFRLQVPQQGGMSLHVTEGKVRLDPTADGAAKIDLSAGQIAAAAEAGESFTLSDAAAISGSKNVVFYRQHPASLGYNAFDHNDQIAVFLESHAISLPEDLRLNVSESGRHDQLQSTSQTIAAGTVVSSYLVHCAPVRLRHIVEGSIRFPTKVIGVISNSESLNATNPTLGAGWTLQCSHVERGLESAPDFNSDVVNISKDRRTVSVRMRTESIDQMRVIVAGE